MNKQKIPYEVPEAETFVMRFEGVLCLSDPSKVYRKNSAGYYEDDEIYENDSY